MVGAGDTSGDREAESGASTVIGSGIVKAFNGANSVIYYGKGGEIASNRAEEQEMTVMCLRILQAALV